MESEVLIMEAQDLSHTLEDKHTPPGYDQGERVERGNSGKSQQRLPLLVNI